MKKYFFFNPDSYYTPDIEPYVDKKTFLSEFNSLIFQEEVKAEKVASIFIFCSALFGFLITYKYETFLLGFGGGGLGLLAYFTGKKIFSIHICSKDTKPDHTPMVYLTIYSPNAWLI